MRESKPFYKQKQTWNPHFALRPSIVRSRKNSCKNNRYLKEKLRLFLLPRIYVPSICRWSNQPIKRESKHCAVILTILIYFILQRGRWKYDEKCHGPSGNRTSDLSHFHGKCAITKYYTTRRQRLHCHTSTVRCYTPSTHKERGNIDHIKLDCCNCIQIPGEEVLFVIGSDI